MTNSVNSAKDLDSILFDISPKSRNLPDYVKRIPGSTKNFL